MPLREIDVEELQEVGPEHVYLVDVREFAEYVDGHVPGALLVPLATVADRLDDFPTDRTIHLICAVGGRSMRAAEFLSGQGLDVVNIAGGTKAWVAGGHPVETGLQGS